MAVQFEPCGEMSPDNEPCDEPKGHEGPHSWEEKTNGEDLEAESKTNY